MREIDILKQVSHQNIIRLYEVIDDPNDDKLYLVLEYASRG
jgi:[calcium/calmodulin-dependent protein kinase] kinase